MSILKLYGARLSSNTRRVATVLIEKKVPFEFIVVDLIKGEQKSPAVLEKQPFGQVPYIDDNDFILYESRAICRYIEEKYPEQGTRLIPRDAQGKALFEQAASVEFAHFNPAAYGILLERIVKPRILGLESDEGAFDAHLTTLSMKLDVYESILSKHKYIAGNELTLADIFHIPAGCMLAAAGTNILSTKGPNVTRWFNELSLRPSWLITKDGVHSVTSY
ncbi:glutathione S-transferase [Mycena rebaudengoi]|nr:glutathione S-transferase [Mycena rebaudengoi]